MYEKGIRGSEVSVAVAMIIFVYRLHDVPDMNPVDGLVPDISGLPPPGER